MLTITETRILELERECRDALRHWTETVCSDADDRGIDVIVAGERLASIVTSLQVLASMLRESNRKAG